MDLADLLEVHANRVARERRGHVRVGAALRLALRLGGRLRLRPPRRRPLRESPRRARRESSPTSASVVVVGRDADRVIDDVDAALHEEAVDVVRLHFGEVDVAQCTLNLLFGEVALGLAHLDEGLDGGQFKLRNDLAGTGCDLRLRGRLLGGGAFGFAGVFSTAAGFAFAGAFALGAGFSAAGAFAAGCLRLCGCLLGSGLRHRLCRGSRFGGLGSGVRSVFLGAGLTQSLRLHI